MIWQGILEYARLHGTIPIEEEKVVIYDNVIGKYDKIWGNKLM